ncbi:MULTISPECIES: metallophosphoesterase family protein [unclassified Exiguobacterium]|uniref:metallophosphoesterase family protein n=1 Tax=unclassified Exiguobacterium TaxID=2644629 RepID=UPI001BE60185|nr:MULTISPECIES: metallophosphoesterase family protein [unclassified Exiguobacterium]
MKLAIISDPHGSFDDLKAVLDDVHRETEHILCLGDLYECHIGKKRRHERFHHVEDVVTYDPNYEALLTFPSLGGNQEERIDEVLEIDHPIKTRISSLPEQMTFGEACFLHGHQIKWRENWEPLVEKGEYPLVFIGHSHISGIYRKGKSLPWDIETPFSLKKKRYVINVGAVIFDREWCLYDTEARTVTRMKV